MRNPQTRDHITAALRELGLSPGSIAFLHSSMSSMGYVAGGADTLVDAFLRVLDPAGTLVVPTFTFYHSSSAIPIFDPAKDRSGMGRITEVTRTRSEARRSRHLIHSVAALGKQAEEITASHGPSAFAADGPFWMLYELDAHILLLGVPYLRCTFIHVLEQLVQVPYRQWREVGAHVQDPDGSLRPLPTFTYGPKPNFAGNDFNKLGALLEGQGLVQVGSVGNAVARLFRARDALEIGLAQYRVDPQFFLMSGQHITPLQDGILTEELHNEKSVLDPAHIYQNP